MSRKNIVVKPFINKRTKQLSVTIPKKKLKKLDPTLKFGEDLFVRLEVFKKKQRKKKKR